MVMLPKTSDWIFFRLRLPLTKPCQAQPCQLFPSVRLYLVTSYPRLVFGLPAIEIRRVQWIHCMESAVSNYLGRRAPA